MKQTWVHKYITGEYQEGSGKSTEMPSWVLDLAGGGLKIDTACWRGGAPGTSTRRQLSKLGRQVKNTIKVLLYVTSHVTKNMMDVSTHYEVTSADTKSSSGYRIVVLLQEVMDQ